MTKDEALLMAIEALDNADYHRADEAIVIIKEALAQPEQEPAAWMVYTQDGQSVYVTDNPTDIQENQRAFAMYTTPQRTWDGLSDKELNVIGSQWHFNLLGKDDKADLFAFAQAIETALKEKNA